MALDQISIQDWHRIFVGEAPGIFYIEVILRTAVVYLILLTSIRMMGKRMASQLGASDLVAMVAMAAAIGVPIHSPDRGLLPAVVVAFAVVNIQRFIASGSAKSEKFEAITQGRIGILVEDSEMILKNFSNSNISRERVFAQLRHMDVRHLGEVKRFYIEANGSFSLLKNEEEVSGLAVLPTWEKELLAKMKKDPEAIVCYKCGHKEPNSFEVNTPCSHCNDTNWVEAVTK
ncbi:DUF421 domain-containing protein [Dyadobacter sediminis]|nr:YetF domain-containing protein [Dyadobacter sediminis]GGB85829.1 hypothetical protein GCM10011325_11810 [Dyadobacter sediminis]